MLSCMYYSRIKDFDTENGIGIGVALFVSGCTHHCKNCWNAETWNFCNGEEFTDSTLKELLGYLDHYYVEYFSILGGEPFEQQNKKKVLDILKSVRNKYGDGLKYFIWSGYTYETLMQDEISSQILSLCDYLIDGEYVDEERDLSLLLRGSRNQRIIDLKVTSNMLGIKVLTREEELY